MQASRLSIAVCLVLLMVFPAQAASAHSNEGTASPIPTDCPLGYACYWTSLSYIGSRTQVAGNNSTWSSSWSNYNEDDSAFNNGQFYSNRTWEGEGRTGDSYCLAKQTGYTDIPFHHDRDAEANYWYSLC